MTTEKATKPEFCTEAMLDYLDNLRESGATNMLGAARYLDQAFPELIDDSTGFHSSAKAREVLAYWMKTFPREGRSGG